MNILIADDEKLIRIGLIHMLNELYPDRFTYQEARNGEELFSLASSANPDLIFIDIRMPLTDGLSAMERLRADGYQGPFLVLTGFSEFDYAKKSIELGASGYLLKPVAPADLKKATERVLAQIQEQYHRENESFSRQILQLLSCPDTAGIPDFSEQKWNSRYFNGFLFLFDMRKKNFYGTLAKELLEQLSDFVRQHAAAPLYYTLFLTTGGEPVLFIESGAGFTQIRDLLSSFLEERRVRASVCYFRGLAILDALHMLTTLQEISCLHMVYPYGSFLAAAELAELASMQPKLLLFLQTVNAFSFACLEKNEASCLQLSKKLQTRIHGLAVTHQQLQCLCAHLANVFSEFSFSISDISCNSSCEKEQPVSDNCTGRELRDFFQALSVLSASVSRRRQNSSALLIPQIQDYIHTHYMQDLSIETIADRFDLSPNYISRLFHEHTGCRFTAYVTKVRMEKAGSLLRENPSLSVKAVAEAVGYYSPRYFSKIFQEHMGALPSEYRFAADRNTPTPQKA